MEYKQYYDAKEFYGAVYPVLMRHEAQNALPLGNVIIGNKGGEAEGRRNATLRSCSSSGNSGFAVNPSRKKETRTGRFAGNSHLRGECIPQKNHSGGIPS